MFNVLLYYSDCCLSLMTWLMSPCSSSSYKCEAVGHRPPVFPDHHDEDRSHQAHRVHGVFEKVSVHGGALLVSLPSRTTGGRGTTLILKCINRMN